MPNYITSNTKKGVRDPVYTDLDPSLSVNPKTEDMMLLQDTKAIRRSVMNLLSTAYGERLFQPNIGASLRAILFEPIDGITTLEIRDRILNTLRTHEPRIGTLFVDVRSSPDQNSYDVSIEFSVRASGQKERVDTVLERIR